MGEAKIQEVLSSDHNALSAADDLLERVRRILRSPGERTWRMQLLKGDDGSEALDVSIGPTAPTVEE